MKALFVAWRDPETRSWSPVGRLTRESGIYNFVYTQGAKNSPNSRSFGRMNDLHKGYKSDELFPIFANRVLAKNRREYDDYLRWLGMSDAAYDELDELARTGGLRVTDTLELFPCPEPNEHKNYEVNFFFRGLQYLHAENRDRARELKPNDRLFLMQDLQNPQDDRRFCYEQSIRLRLLGIAPVIIQQSFLS